MNEEEKKGDNAPGLEAREGGPIRGMEAEIKALFPFHMTKAPDLERVLLKIDSRLRAIEGLL